MTTVIEGILGCIAAWFLASLLGAGAIEIIEKWCDQDKGHEDLEESSGG
jgi:hypothetical protein